MSKKAAPPPNQLLHPTLFRTPFWVRLLARTQKRLLQSAAELGRYASNIA